MKLQKCDHCGKEFEKRTYKNYFVTKTMTHTVHVIINPKDYSDSCYKDYTVEKTYDVCDSCYEELLKWLHEEE